MSDHHENGFGRRGLQLPDSDLGRDSFEPYRAFGGEEYYGEPIATLVFHLKDGRQLGKPYHRVNEFSFDPALGISIAYPDLVVTLTGRNLESLFRLICEGKVQWVSEADRPTALLVPETEVVVEAITCGPGRSE